MKLKTFDFLCRNCGNKEVRMLDLEEDDINQQSCPHCASLMIKVIGAPTVLKKSWPDGHREKNDKSWRKTARTIDLEIAASESDYDTSIEIKKEINKINKE